MSGIFRGLQIGVSSLMAHQQAINVTSQNIANMNTPGYQRQRVNFRELSGPSGLINPPLVGTGVYADRISRFVTPFIDQQIRHQNGLKNQAETTVNMLLDVESSLIEPSESGLSASLDEFWQSWQNLVVTPTEPATRVTLVQTGEQLASSIREARSFIDSFRENLTTQIQINFNQINEIAQEVSDLNRQILRANAQTGISAGGAIALEQQRDQLFFDLSKLVDYNLSFQENGLARVTIGNYALVDDGGPQKIQLDEDGHMIWAINGRRVQLNSGEMRAMVDMRDQVLPGIIGGLDEMAKGLIDSVNDIHRQGYGLNGVTGLNFFVGEDAATISVNELLVNVPESIATASQPGRTGDVSIAVEISELNSRAVMGPNGQYSINAFFRTLVTEMGMKTQQARRQLSSSEVISEHLDNRRQSISGVSLDEEVANLVTYEKAFQASARIINVIDEMLDQVINRMGLAGR
jgi:flagellar hook-associated protein 1 FlgK